LPVLWLVGVAGTISLPVLRLVVRCASPEEEGCLLLRLRPPLSATTTLLGSEAMTLLYASSTDTLVMAAASPDATRSLAHATCRNTAPPPSPTSQR
jgi:hypothetical protein